MLNLRRPVMGLELQSGRMGNHTSSLVESPGGALTRWNAAHGRHFLCQCSPDSLPFEPGLILCRAARQDLPTVAPRVD